MTLAPKTSKVSWVYMGLRWVLFLAEVLFVSIEVPGFLSGPEVAGLRAKSCGTPPAVLRRAGSRSNLAGGRLAVTSRCVAPSELVPLRVLIPRYGRRSAPVASLIILISESPPS
jgi:hypothetical protein